MTELKRNYVIMSVILGGLLFYIPTEKAHYDRIPKNVSITSLCDMRGERQQKSIDSLHSRSDILGILCIFSILSQIGLLWSIWGCHYLALPPEGVQLPIAPPCRRIEKRAHVCMCRGQCMQAYTKGFFLLLHWIHTITIVL